MIARLNGVRGRVRLGWLSFWGWLANLAGWPCVVREGRYESPALGASVRVRSSSLYTVVTVNGLDVYFYRLSGGLDGVALSPTSDYTGSDTARLADSAVPLSDSRPPSQN